MFQVVIYFRDGRMYLVPVEEVVKLRPSLAHLDRDKEVEEKREKKAPEVAAEERCQVQARCGGLNITPKKPSDQPFHVKSDSKFNCKRAGIWGSGRPKPQSQV